MNAKKWFLGALLAAEGLVAHAGLQRVGPVDPANGGYPAWYQDKTGLTLEFGQPINQSELNGGWLLILPANLPTGAVPEVPFTNYSAEHFYWNATAGSKVQGGMSLVLSLEGAFTTPTPKPGEQLVFGRLRIKIASIPIAGNYKVYTPFGVYDFPGMQAGDRLFFTQDIGFACGTNFACALDAAIGPFLLPSNFPGDAEVPPIPDLQAGQDAYYDALAVKTPYPATGRKYTADPARLGPLTGATCTLTAPAPVNPQPGDCILGNAPTDRKNQNGTFVRPPHPVYITSAGLRDPNIFRVEVDGVEVPPAAGGEHAFTTVGRVMSSSIPGRVTVDRASYGETAVGAKKLDVFVTAFPTTSPRLPAGASAVTSGPDLGYYDTACGVDAAGKLTAPTNTGIGGVPVTYFQMFRNSPTGNTWWGQNAPQAIPTQVCVLDNSQISPSYFQANVADEVDITAAIFSPATATLSVSATSSDCFSTPTLKLDGFADMQPDATGCGHTLSISNVPAPPSRVAVTSLRGGVASRDVRTGVGVPTITGVVDTNADTVTLFEDCSPTAATSCATPAVIDVLLNDTLDGSPIDPTKVTVNLATPATNGTATVVGHTISYVPNPNFNGADLVGYTVTVNATGTVSAEGYLHLTVAPVNDVPTAVNDSLGVPSGKATAFNLLANDTDPDGAADLDAAVITSLPAAGATLTCNGGAVVNVGTVCVGGNVSITASGGGAVFTFGYQARDKSLGLSTNTATVAVTVNAAEAIVLSKSIFTAKSWRWTVTGTDNVAANQTLTITYDIATPPTYKVNGTCTAMTAATNPVIGTAAVDALGNWSYDTSVSSAGTVNPTNTGSNGTGFWCSPPKSIRVTSPLGASQTSVINLK